MLCNESITSEGLTQVISPCEISSMETKQIRLERFREIWRSQFNGNIAALARALGSSANQVRFYLNPDKPGGRWMGEDFARDIERILGLDKGYLDREADAPGRLINLSEHPDLCPVRRVNFKLAAGVHGYAVELDNGDRAPVFFRNDWIQANHYRPEKLVAFRVSGSSMEPSLWDGDLVVINLDDTSLTDGDVFAVSYEGEPGIKRLRRDAGEWWLASDNADQRKFAPKRCTEDVEILGRVIYKQSDHI